MQAPEGDFNNDSEEPLVVRVSRTINDDKTIDLFDHVELDGEIVDTSNYTAVVVSVIITFEKEFISVGENPFLLTKCR